MSRTHRIGTVLFCEDGNAVVVEPDTTPLDGLLTLVEEVTGDRFAETNPAILAALPSVRVSTWFSCTKVWREANGHEDEDWWSPDGDGSRRTTVACLDGNAYRLADEAAAVEPSGVNGEQPADQEAQR